MIRYLRYWLLQNNTFYYYKIYAIYSFDYSFTFFKLLLLHVNFIQEVYNVQKIPIAL